jgi:hypothetical protein
MPPNKKAATHGTARATGSDSYLLGVPGSLALWTYGVPLVTWEAIERASRAQPRDSAPRRVPRRSNGNSLPLIGLRPSIKYVT